MALQTEPKKTDTGCSEKKSSASVHFIHFELTAGKSKDPNDSPATVAPSLSATYKGMVYECPSWNDVKLMANDQAKYLRLDNNKNEMKIDPTVRGFGDFDVPVILWHERMYIMQVNLIINVITDIALHKTKEEKQDTIDIRIDHF
jgi:hypothetical protein